jgi:hypothetical protein
MSRLLKALSLALALIALGVFAASCGSSSAQLRVVQAISDSPVNLDIDLNGKSTFTNVGFESIQPSTGYQKVSTGSDPIEVFNTGTTTDVIASTNLNLGGGSQYTVVLQGYVTAGAGTANAPAAVLLTDNNAAPSSGNVEFRIINSSPASPSGSVDVYIVPPGTDITQVTPQVSGLAYGQGSGYQSLAAATYELVVTPQGNTTRYVDQNYSLTAGQIRSFVLVDVSGGGALSGLPLELSDLN